MARQEDEAFVVELIKEIRKKDRGVGVVIGGNIWLTHDVPADTKLFYQQK